MAFFGRNWLEDNDDDINVFSHWKEDFGEHYSNIEYIEKPKKKKLSNQEIINIINKRSKKDKEFITKNINL